MGKRQSSVHKNKKSGDLFSGFLNDLEMEFESDVKPPFIEWVEGIVLDGKKFSFKGHEYLITPYKDDHPYQIYIKATQLGLTTLAMIRSFYKAIYEDYRGILYMFPSKSDVSDFSRGRISPLMEENPDVIGKYIKNTDSINIKQISDCFLYLRGMKSRTGLKSVPIDYLLADELDEAPQLSLDMAHERLAHSEHKIQLFFSNPTLPDYGVDRYFKETDQRYYLLKCPKCGEYTDMVETFPECLIDVKGRIIRACVKCSAELDTSKGEWVAKYPSIEDKRGYQFSQLYSNYVTPESILNQYKTTNNLTDFYNLKIGLAYVSAENRLSIEEVISLCGNKGIAGNSNEACFMGVDQGQEIHVVIGKKHEEKKCEIVHIGIYKDWQELDYLMKRFSVARCVVDAMPEIRNARAFAERFLGKVYLNYYLKHAKGSYRWNDREKIVNVNRTESLDASHHLIMNQEVILPRDSEMVKKFAIHCHNVAKKIKEDEESGSKYYEYIKLGPDHFRHAFNYLCVAMESNVNYMYETFALGG